MFSGNMTSVIRSRSSASTPTAQGVDKDKDLGPQMTLTDMFGASTREMKFTDDVAMCFLATSVNAKPKAGNLLVRIISGSISIDAMIWTRTKSKELLYG